MALLSRRPRLKPEVRQDLINQFLSTNDAEILAAPVSEPGVFVAASFALAAVAKHLDAGGRACLCERALAIARSQDSRWRSTGLIAAASMMNPALRHRYWKKL